MAVPEKHIQKVMQLLTAWNPLGDKVNNVEGLDGYRTEAIDILFHVNFQGPKTDPAKIVQTVLNQAFDLSLSFEECNDVGRKISEFLEGS